MGTAVEGTALGAAVGDGTGAADGYSGEIVKRHCIDRLIDDENKTMMIGMLYETEIIRDKK